MNKILLLNQSTSNQARKGLVRSIGKAVTDDTGVFNPLGITFYWGLNGWKNERARTEQNIAFFAKHGIDYVTIICDVSWGSHSADDDFESNLTSFIDTVFDKYGIRCYLILQGDRQSDPFVTVYKTINVVRPRSNKVIALECWNEYARDNGDLTTIKQMHALLGAALPNLIALTSPDPFNWNEIIDESTEISANLISIHRPRGSEDNGWRNVRQAWDFKDYQPVIADSEPAGPESSIYSETSLALLIMMRVNALVCGAAFHQIHIADMVGGIVDPHYGRVANIWEVNNIEQILKSIRNLDKIIPAGLQNWNHSDNGNPGCVLRFTDFWPDGAPVGINRNYQANNDQGFVSAILGVKIRASGQVLMPLLAKVYDCVTLEEVLEFSNSFLLPGTDDTRTGYIIMGKFL